MSEAAIKEFAKLLPYMIGFELNSDEFDSDNNNPSAGTTNGVCGFSCIKPIKKPN